MGALRTDVERLTGLVPDPKGATDGQLIAKTSYVDSRGLTQDTYKLVPAPSGGGGGFYIDGNAPAGITGTPYSFFPTPVGFSPDDWEALTPLGTPPPGVVTNATTGEQAGNPTVHATYSWYVSGRESASGKTAIVHLRAVIANGAPSWDSVVTGYGPVLWFKMNETSAANFLANGNWGSGGGSASMSTGGGTLTWGNAGIMPSDTTRLTAKMALSAGGWTNITLATPVTMGNCSIYWVIGNCTTGVPAYIPYRAMTHGGTVTNDTFIRFDTGVLSYRVNGNSFGTTIPASAVMDGNPHLIGSVFDGTNVYTWIDGVLRSTDAAPQSGTNPYWSYLCNGSSDNQFMAGNFGDFVIFNSTLTSSDHMALYAAWL